MALSIVLDSKLTYPAACNAVETVLVHRAIVAGVMLPLLGTLLEKGVEVRGCEETCAASHGLPVTPATEEDWRTEYSAPVVSVKIVESLDEAIAWVNRYGSSHTEAIVTDDRLAAERFLAEVDAAGVYHNASTRFADGTRYGLGAEVGIATGKLHARGPVGLEGLVTYRYCEATDRSRLPTARRGVPSGTRSSPFADGCGRLPTARRGVPSGTRSSPFADGCGRRPRLPNSGSPPRARRC